MKRPLTAILVGLVVIAGVSLFLLYASYKTAGEYSAKVTLEPLNGDYMVTGLLVKAKPYRLEGYYFISLKFNIEVTTNITDKALFSSMRDKIARKYVEVLCPNLYTYYVDIPFRTKSVSAPPLKVEATYKLPVRIDVKGFKIHLEPGKEAVAEIKIKPSCIILHEMVRPTVELVPLGGGIVVGIEEVEVVFGEG